MANLGSKAKSDRRPMLEWWCEDGMNENRPHGHVAVIAQWRDGLTGVPTAYVHAVEAAGARAHVFSTFEAPRDNAGTHVPLSTGLDPHDPSPLDGAVGLVIPGGGDVDPKWYGQAPHPRTTKVSHRRDRFELTLLEEALQRDLPVLAICHGMQLLNVHLGGTLEQHLGDVPGRLQHDRDLPRADAVHRVKLEGDSLLAGIFGSDEVPVNSSHHQALERVAEPLAEVGWADDGVLEAVVSREHQWVVGVQWHPEAMAAVDRTQRALFDAFVAATEPLESRTVTSAAR